MQIFTNQNEVVKCETLITERFENYKNKWEEVDIATEKAIIKGGAYYLENKSSTDWNYYKIKSGLKKYQDFVFDAIVQLEKKEDNFGHFGLVWGFDKNLDFLNRFTLSADGKRALVMQFEKDHHKIVYRFQNRKLPKFNLKKPIRFSIIKMNDYFHFLINKQSIYCSHESHFVNMGNYIGYYLEPGLSIKSSFLEVKMISAKIFEGKKGLQQLIG